MTRREVDVADSQSRNLGGVQTCVRCEPDEHTEGCCVFQGGMLRINLRGREEGGREVLGAVFSANSFAPHGLSPISRCRSA